MISDYKGTFDFRFFTARGTILTIDLSDNHKNESNSGTECTLSFDQRPGQHLQFMQC